MNIDEYKAEEEKRINRCLHHMENGVCFVDIRQAYIDEGVQIGRGTVIGPCVTLQGDTTIGENCTIGQNTQIKDSRIGDNVQIQSSVILESAVGDKTSIGPFAYLRPNSKVGTECKVGDFVEIKNSNLGDGTKAAHLTYIGDADVGSGVNLGCGVVFVNYDGSHKYRTTVDDDAFIGCNSNLISPVKVGKGAYIAAGSTVSEDVEKDSLYIARSRGTQKSGWVSKRGIWKSK